MTVGAVTELVRQSMINEARTDLSDSLGQLQVAQVDRRNASAAAQLAVDEERNALLEAEWMLDSHFYTQGNKTIYRADDGSEKSMTADERKAWKQAEARKQPAVVDAAAAARKMQEAEQVAVDALVLAERRFTACKYAVSAAVAHLNFLTAAVAVTDVGGSDAS